MVLNIFMLGLGAVLFVLLLTAACSNTATNEKADKEKHLTFIYNFATNSLDPNVDSSYVPLRAGITETLIRLNEEKLTIEPWLTESWEGKRNELEWTIQIRDGITIQNRNPLDGNSVKASLERSLKDNIAIQNALKIEGMETEGQTIHITLKEPSPKFISELVTPNTSIIDVTEVDYVNKPIGTGPFTLTSFTPGSKLELERYEDYWDGKAKLDSVSFVFNEDSNARSLALE